MSSLSFDNYADILLVTNDNYNGITEQAHDRIGVLIEELTTDEAEIFIHNPPIVLNQYLENIKDEEDITIDYQKLVNPCGI